MKNWWNLGRQSLEALRTPLGITASRAGEHFHAIFGRDSLWSIMLVMEAVELRPTDQEYRTWAHTLTTEVLRGMTRLQGREENDYNEEQPGKIVHEYWDPVPQHLLRGAWPMVEGRYYGTFDATFLFIIAIQRAYKIFADQQLLDELWPGALAALNWALQYSDLDNDGLVEYKRRNPNQHGLTHHVWKDSWDSVLLPEDLPADHPIAWIEMQGYAIKAYSVMYSLLKQRGELTPELAERISQRRQGINQALERYWLAEENCYTIAIDGKKVPVKAIASNVGHLLWSQAVDSESAAFIAQRLSQPDILTTWGLRTLSQKAHYYNPMIYHRGTVWPFDNAVAAIGLHRYGFEQQARDLANSIMRAINAFSLPVEVYCVMPSGWVREPTINQEWILVDYAEACSVQAWTAAAIIYFSALLDES